MPPEDPVPHQWFHFHHAHPEARLSVYCVHSPVLNSGYSTWCYINNSNIRISSCFYISQIRRHLLILRLSWWVYPFPTTGEIIVSIIISRFFHLKKCVGCHTSDYLRQKTCNCLAVTSIQKHCCVCLVSERVFSGSNQEIQPLVSSLGVGQHQYTTHFPAPVLARHCAF